MANMKRVANRERSARNGMDQREATHREPKYSGEGYRGDGSHGAAGRTSGSPRHLTESFGPGPVPGAGEIGGNFGAPSSGVASRYVRTDQTENPNRKTPAGGSAGKRLVDDGE